MPGQADRARYCRRTERRAARARSGRSRRRVWKRLLEQPDRRFTDPPRQVFEIPAARIVNRVSAAEPRPHKSACTWRRRAANGNAAESTPSNHRGERRRDRPRHRVPPASTFFHRDATSGQFDETRLVQRQRLEHHGVAAVLQRRQLLAGGSPSRIDGA